MSTEIIKPKIDFAGKEILDIYRYFRSIGWEENTEAPQISNSMMCEGDEVYAKFWHKGTHKDTLILLSDILILRCVEENADILLFSRKVKN